MEFLLLKQPFIDEKFGWEIDSVKMFRSIMLTQQFLYGETGVKTFSVNDRTMCVSTENWTRLVNCCISIIIGKINILSVDHGRIGKGDSHV